MRPNRSMRSRTVISGTSDVEVADMGVLLSAMNGAPAIVNRLIDDLRTFVGSQSQNDDITLIAIRKT